ncbi:UNVERIFIED_CONTAM: hypothetical protein K2H54_055026 [Gekko kuhli]
MEYVRWERAHEGTVDTIVKYTQLCQSVYGSDYEERVEISCPAPANTIVLWNVTESDSGMFICSYIGASGEFRVHWTKLTVTVNVPLDYKMNILALVGGGGVGAVILLLTLILSIAAAVAHHRKKKRKRIMMLPKVFLTTQPQDFSGRTTESERETMTASAPKREAIYVNYSGGKKMRI